VSGPHVADRGFKSSAAPGSLGLAVSDRSTKLLARGRVVAGGSHRLVARSSACSLPQPFSWCHGAVARKLFGGRAVYGLEASTRRSPGRRGGRDGRCPSSTRQRGGGRGRGRLPVNGCRAFCRHCHAEEQRARCGQLPRDGRRAQLSCVASCERSGCSSWRSGCAGRSPCGTRRRSARGTRRRSPRLPACVARSRRAPRG